MKDLRNLREILRINTNRYNQFEDCISDLLSDRTVCSMNDYIQHADVTCLEHCLNVSYHSYLICRFLKLDYESAARGALLHDLFLYDWHITKTNKGWHAFTHPYTALKNANDIFELNNMEKDIIVKHMWPVTMHLPRYAESLVVSFTDKFCALMETIISNRRSRLAKKYVLLKYRLNCV